MLPSNDKTMPLKELQLLETIGNNLSGNVLYQLKWDVDGTKKFTFVSPNVLIYTGTSVEDVINNPEILNGIIAKDYVDELLAKELDAYNNLVPYSIDVECTNAINEIRWINIHSIPQKNDDGSVLWHGMITDITHSKTIEKKLSKYNHELTLLTTVNDVILTACNEQTLFEDVCRIIVTQGGYKLAWVALYPDESCQQQNVVPFVAFGETRYLKEIHIDLTDDQLNKGPTAICLKKGITSITNDFLGSTQVTPWQETARKYEIAASIVIPLEFQFRKRGTINIYSSNINAFDEHEVLVLERLAKNVTLAAQNLFNLKEKERTAYQLKERVKELQTLYLVKKIIQNETEPFDELIQKIVNLLPAGWQFPECCTARIQLYGKEYKSSEDTVGVASQQSPIILPGETIGFIEIIYKNIFSDEKEGPFLQEERDLINAVSEILGNYCAKKRSLDALKRSEANIRSVFENSEIGFALLDLQFNIIAINKLMQQEYSKLTGLNLEQNGNLINQLRPEKQETMRHQLNNVITNCEANHFDINFNHNNQESTFDVTLVPVKNNNEVIGISLAAANITARKIMEREREQITNDLIQRNRDLEQFAYIVSHNLRGPLSSILGLNLLLDEDITEEEKKLALRGIDQSAKSLDSVLKDLNTILQIRRDITLQKEKIELNALFNNVTNSIAHNIVESNTSFDIDFSAAPTILSSKAYLGSIFYNLISNSIKYAQPGIPPAITIKSSQTDKYITIQYKDNSIGIDLKRYNDQLFGLYKRFHPQIEGKGLGLFMVKTQVEAMGGTITAKSEPNQGMAFIITFSKYDG